MADLFPYLVLLSLSLQNSPCIGSGGRDEGYGTCQDISSGFGLVHRGLREAGVAAGEKERIARTSR